MLLIPYHRAVLQTGRKVPDVVARLEVAIYMPPPDGKHATGPSLRGEVRGTAFTLGLVERGMNTYAPWIRGQVAPAAQGSQLTAVMTVHPVAWVLLAAFYTSMWWSGAARAGTALALFGVFHIAMCLVGFWPAARRAEDALRKSVGG